MLANKMGITISHPYCAPALVDSTKWEVPMAVLAKRRPGPRFLISFCMEAIIDIAGVNIAKIT